MDKIYNRKGKLAGYLRDNAVYTRHNEIVGYVQENVFLDINFNPIAFISEDVIYAASGKPWAYRDGRAIRDMSGNRIGSVNKKMPELLAAGSILGLGIGAESDNHNTDNYNTGAYGAQGGTGSSIFGGLGAIGASINRTLFGGPRQMPMGYGANPYYQERHDHRSHRHHRHRNDNVNYNYSHRSHRHRRYDEMAYTNRWYRPGDYAPIRYGRQPEYYGRNDYEYEYDRNAPDSNRQNGSDSKSPGIGRMLLNNIGPIASTVGRYMFSGSNLANMANLAGLGGLGNAAGAAGAVDFESMAPIINAMAGMFGGAGAAAGGAEAAAVAAVAPPVA